MPDSQRYPLNLSLINNGEKSTFFQGFYLQEKPQMKIIYFKREKLKAEK